MNDFKLSVGILYKNGQEDVLDTYYETEAEALAERQRLMCEWDDDTGGFAALGDHFFVRVKEVARLSMMVDEYGPMVRYFA